MATAAERTAAWRERQRQGVPSRVAALEEQYAALETLLRADPRRATSELQAEVGCSAGAVAKIRAQVARALLAAITAPDLAAAACKGQHHLFDPIGPGEKTPKRHRVAREICSGCPELGPCRAWVSALPPADRPSGVVAGKVYP